MTRDRGVLLIGRECFSSPSPAGVEDREIKINDGLVILYFAEDARIDEGRTS